MLCQRSLLSTPSICQFIWFARVPFSDPYPPPEYPAYPGVSCTICVKSRPFNGRFATSLALSTVVCVTVVVSRAIAAAFTSTTVFVPELATGSFTGSV